MARDIKQCHPKLQTLAGKLVSECKKQGLIIGIGECVRTVAEQDALYAKGRTVKGNIVTNAKGSSYSSMHQWGVAFDFYRNDGKGAYNESGDFFTKVGKIGQKLGLEWGGSWKSITDKPHFQLPDWGSTTSKLKSLYGTPDKFKKTWTTKTTTNEVKATVNSDSLAIRKSKGTAKCGTKITTLTKGKSVVVVKKNAETQVINGTSYAMAKITYGSISGYVAQKFLKF